MKLPKVTERRETEVVLLYDIDMEVKVSAYYYSVKLLFTAARPLPRFDHTTFGS